MSTYGLLTDLYELTMAQGYFLQEMNTPTVFDMFYRRNPYKGGFAVFAGLEDLLQIIRDFRFSPEDLAYLQSLKLFRTCFLDYLADFHFTGSIYSCAEGTTVFPNQTLLRVHGTLIEAQLLESILLNTLNFQTLIATKTARLYLASGKGMLLEFGLRRAQGINGALSATRAAIIGGAAATSNTQAGRNYGIPVKGTMAHSWVMAFPSEEEAFRKYAELYPDNCILLIDTYNTLGSGIKNALTIFRELKAAGRKDYGVRLDSGDPLSLSREVRRILDDAGLSEARITLSGDLDEELIFKLVANGAPIDFWGVGTRLVTGHNDGALTGVYKLAAIQREGQWQAVCKISNDKHKASLPGIKQVHRYLQDNQLCFDVVALEEENPEDLLKGQLYLKDPQNGSYMPAKSSIESTTRTCLLSLKMKEGTAVLPAPGITAIRAATLRWLEQLPEAHLRLHAPETYRVYISEKVYKRVGLSRLAGKISEQHSSLG